MTLAQSPADCLASGGNPVACENLNAGSLASEWDVNGAGDPSIQGFATEMSVNRGERVYFKIRTAASAYQLRIYRMGYYGGRGARLVTTVLPSAQLPQSQPSCVTDAATGLVDCGNWAVSASWLVPSTAVSGIYFAKAIRSDTGGASHIFFIVRDDSGGSDILFQTADTTWQAYNSYGGNSLYTGSPAGRAYKVSYNRPFNNRTFGGGPRESFVFNAEYPMVRWLEANGYDVSYTTGIEAERRGAELLEHRVFLSVGHDEYWSAGQRANVEAARDAGTHLAFFSGNEVFWKTRWESSIAGTATAYRTLVCYKETTAGDKIDPLPDVWTGTWRDPRFSPPADGGRPENALTGTLFMVNGPRNDAITVPAADGRLRFWRNTSIASMPLGQTATLPLGTLGYEWDMDVDNGSRPAGLIRMSNTTVDVSPLFLQDYGSKYGSGIANHALTLYRHPSGALVFGAGTVQWSWGLDNVHDHLGEPPDVRMQQATVNLLADMDAQPGTLQPGLVPASASTDLVPATSVISFPAQGAAIDVGTPVTITGTASDQSGVIGAVEVSLDNGATWRPASGREQWSLTGTFTQVGPATIRSRAIDDSGNIETPAGGVAITVRPDENPPVISGVQVASALSTWATVTWTTNEFADSRVEYGLTTAYGSLTPLDTELVTSHVRSLGGLTPNTTYHFRVHSRDGAGNLAVSGDFSFTTAAADAIQTVTFDDLAGQDRALQGEYPLAVIDWGTGGWWHSGPWGLFTTKSVTFQSGVTSATAQFVQPLRLLRLEAYNGDPSAATVTLSCPGQTTVQVQVAAGQTRTIATGWTDACAEMTLSASNGWGTNFDDMEFDAPPDTAAPVLTAVQATLVTSSTARITWTTSEKADTQVEYGPTPAYGSVSPLESALATAHAVNLSGLAAGTTYHYRVRSRDGSGNLSVSADATFTTPGPGTCPCSLWPLTATPGVASASDANAVELGVRFRASQDGYILGLRFYKGAGNTGVHAGHLWTGTGELLAAATFTAETATGWQEVAFDAPVSVAANTIYVASYYAPNGAYARDSNYFGTAHDAPPLQAIASGAEGANGVYRYGPSGFPTATYQASNYWVDVVFVTGADVRPPAITDVQTFVPMATSATISWATNEPADGQVEFGLTTSYGSLSPLSAELVMSRGIALSGLSPQTTYHFRVRSRDASGNLAVSGDGTFTTPAPDLTAPVISDAQVTLVTSSTARVSWATNEFADTQVEYGPTPAYGTVSPLDGTLATSHAVGLTGLAEGATYHYRVRSRDASGNLAVTADATFTTPGPGTCPCSLWPLTATPVVASASDATAIELGVRFRAAQDGYISALRFYKGPANTGVHVAHLWTGAGTLVATATFTNETGTGWQEAAFPAPVAVAANTTYVASYFAPNGGYARDTDYFHAPLVAGPLEALSTGAAGGNGVYRYGSSGFPTDSYIATNYWVDVVFVNGPDVLPPAISGVAATAAATSATITWTTNEAADGQVEFGPTTSYGSVSPLVSSPSTAHSIALSGLTPQTTYHFRVRSRDAAGNASVSADGTFTTTAGETTPPVIAASQATLVTSSTARISWLTDENADTQVEFGLTTSYGSLSPLDPVLRTSHAVELGGLTAGTTYHYRVRSRDVSGNLATSPDATFTTPAPGTCPCSLFPLNAIPVVESASDTSAIELGVRFRSDQGGYITGLRFYKGAGNTGVHVAHLWTQAGQLLATATFTNETGSGWQEAKFATPVAIAANTNYVASYFAPAGGYAVNYDYFKQTYDSGVLHAPRDTGNARNGLYRYGSSGFPTSSYNASNYWVDVVFSVTP